MPSPTYVPVIRTGVDVTFANITATGTLTVTGAAALNGGGTFGPTLTGTGAAAGTAMLGLLATGDGFDRFRIQAGGAHEWGPGNAPRDTGMSRGAANRLDVTTADLRVATAGRGLQVAEGANAKAGVATLVGGTFTVNTTAVTANSRIQLTPQTLGTVARPQGVGVTARVAGTSFTITSTDATDTSTVAWLIVEP